MKTIAFTILSAAACLTVYEQHTNREVQGEAPTYRIINVGGREIYIPKKLESKSKKHVIYPGMKGVEEEKKSGC